MDRPKAGHDFRRNPFCRDVPLVSYFLGIPYAFLTPKYLLHLACLVVLRVWPTSLMGGEGPAWVGLPRLRVVGVEEDDQPTSLGRRGGQMRGV